ncbi:MAG: PilZ domain-containing protein [Bryobacteraceae bacterium]
MERRREARFQTQQQVEVAILTEPRSQCVGRILDTSGRGLRLVLPFAVTLGAAVRVDSPDALLLGEVCHCGPADDGFTVGLVLDQTLTGLGDLVRLNRSLLGESAREAPVPAPQHTGAYE